MALEIRRFRAEDEPAINRLNARLSAGGTDHQVYPEPPASRVGGSRRNRVFVAATQSEIHGGVGLVEHEFHLAGEPVNAGWVKYPVAESLVDPSYSGVPASLLFQLMREQVHLMALGMGGHNGPLAKVLAKMGWKGTTVPFYFSILRPFRVFRQLEYLRSSAAMRFAADLLAVTGLGWLGVRAASRLRAPFPSMLLRHVDVEPVARFGAWADSVWQENREAYGFVARRDQAMLNDLYPATFEGISRLRVRRDGQEIGWATVLRMDLRERTGTRYFGKLSIGVVADGFASPANASVVVAAAVRHLKSQDIDLMISNQSHPAWCRALERQGFFSGPSNFAFYRSPTLDRRLENSAVRQKGVLLNRGDCDGPKWI